MAITSTSWVSVADLHLDNSDRYGRTDNEQINSRVRDKIAALNTAVEFAIEHLAGFFVILGDTFDTPRPLPRIKRLFYETLSRLECPIFILLGNHEIGSFDGAFTGDEGLVRIFKGLDRTITIVSSPFMYQGNGYGTKFLFLPWMREFNSDSIPSDAEIVFGHLEISGALSNGFKLPGIDPNTVSNIPYVELGHYHQHQSIGKNIQYVGSLSRCNFGEKDQEKGFVYSRILDPLTIPGKILVESKFIPVPDKEFIEIVFSEAFDNQAVIAGHMGIIKAIFIGSREWLKSSTVANWKSGIKEGNPLAVICFENEIVSREDKNDVFELAESVSEEDVMSDVFQGDKDAAVELLKEVVVE